MNKKELKNRLIALACAIAVADNFSELAGALEKLTEAINQL